MSNPERTPQSPATRARHTPKPTALTSEPAGDEGTKSTESTESLLFYATYGGSTLDPEVRLLAALMAGGQHQGTSGAVMALVAETLGPKDFSTEAYQQLYTLIIERWRAGQMTDPGSINAALLDMGSSTRAVQHLLMEILGVDLPVTRIPELTKQVLIAWYNRQFQAAATYIQQVADEAPAHEKFRLLQQVGSYQANADRRVRAFHQAAAAFWDHHQPTGSQGTGLPNRPELGTTTPPQSSPPQPSPHQPTGDTAKES